MAKKYVNDWEGTVGKEIIRNMSDFKKCNTNESILVFLNSLDTSHLSLESQNYLNSVKQVIPTQSFKRNMVYIGNIICAGYGLRSF